MPFLLFLLLFVILAIVIGWHIIFAILGGVIAITAGVWAIAIISIVIFCAGILLLFFFASLGGLIIGIIFAIWTLLAIILFPILFPILLPLFIIFAFLSYMRRRQTEKKNT